MKLNDSTKVFRTFLNKGRKSGEKALKNAYEILGDVDAAKSARNSLRSFTSKTFNETNVGKMKGIVNKNFEDKNFPKLKKVSKNNMENAAKGQKGFKVSKDSSEAFQSARNKARVFKSKADIEDQMEDVLIDKGLKGESLERGENFKRLRSMSKEEFAEKVEEKQRFKFANNPAKGNAKKYRVDTSEEGKKKIEAALKDRKAKVVDSKGNEKLEELVNKYKENQQKENGFLNKAVPMAIGGAVVFTLANRRGRQSNSQLYGQQGLY